ncbi:MAG: polyphosphate polymerase domain-containing protein [Oscillospiraceae bacterium]|nr:polyphosphate polymerase domain-containing protein [Oscillospiraceae bacterium]
MVAQPVAVMQRYELKYLIDARQTAYVKQELAGHMTMDEYGRTSIASLYYDTPDHRLIRASMEHTPYKEKIRLRSYGLATASSPVFLELKRKAHGIVYKRRVQSTVAQVQQFFGGGSCSGDQIGREITYFRDCYRTLTPACLILYDREAYREPEGDVRLTVDYRPRYRLDPLDLTSSMDGIPLLPEGYAILEIKVQQSVPLWLTKLLDAGQIRKTSFSKYGEAYRQKLTATIQKG